MMSTPAGVFDAIDALGLSGQVIELHAAMSRFEPRVDVIELLDALTSSGTTVIAPTFSHRYEIRPSERIQQAVNGLRHGDPTPREEWMAFRQDVDDVDSGMGALGSRILEAGPVVRGMHPFNSFAAVGPHAAAAAAWQSPARTYGPLEWAMRDGYLVLFGVDLRSATCLHLAERIFGRGHFVRWYFDGERIRPARVGACSAAFNDFAEHIPTPTTMPFRGAMIRCYRLGEVVAAAISALEDLPTLGLCSDPSCERCRVERSRLWLQRDVIEGDG